METSEKADYTFKLIIIGDSGVGKSCILNHFLKKKLKSGMKDTEPTLGVEYSTKYIESDGKRIKM